jgi:hypothetical protein
MKASTVLATAATLVDGDRRSTHGDPKTSFNRIAAMWSAYTGVTISAKDVAHMMALMKMTRTMYGEHNDDDFIDEVGYIALASEVSDG